uniref:Uncharacterized protein n=1 Tax=Sphenodon punctatus TaxID=8508 RepID=A0A8D0GVU9_SPHPU
RKSWEMLKIVDFLMQMKVKELFSLETAITEIFHFNATELQKAVEHNNRLDKEILALRNRVRSLDAERKVFLELVTLGTPSSRGSLCISLFTQCLAGERLLQQQQEEIQQLRQDFHRIQNLCGSAEKELRYEREKNLDLKKYNILLQQESTKVKAELRQGQLKLSDSTKMCSSLTAQWEHSQQKVKELELELLKQSQIIKQQSSLQEKLAQEKTRVADAEKKILELQQKLKESHHQICLLETHLLRRKQLEEEVKEARENEAKVQRQLQEELRKRKLLDQHAEELQQQLRHLHDAESLLAKTHAELQVRFQQQEAQLQVLEEEKKTLSEEVWYQITCGVSIQEGAKLRRAKETFIREVKQRELRIKQLENEITLSKSQTGKVRADENENLLQEKRKLLQQVQEQEEVGRNNKWIISTIQNR